MMYRLDYTQVRLRAIGPTSKEAFEVASYVKYRAKNGVVYIYENISYWDKKDKKTKHRRKCVGHQDPVTGEIHPNGPRGRPSTRKTGASNSENVGNDQEEHAVVLGIGPSRLLDKITVDLGLKKVLQDIFPDDWAEILSCAYYLVSEGEPLSKVGQWSEEFVLPCPDTPSGLASQRISELLLRITESKQQDFFGIWMKKHQDRVCALDITSISSYSELINYVDYGYNRDDEKLPQINMLLVVGEENKLPLYFRVLDGKVTDVKTIVETDKNLELLNIRGTRFCMDKGFYSEKNVDDLYKRHYKYSVGVPFKAGFAKQLVVDHRDMILDHKNLIMVNNNVVYGTTVFEKWKGHVCYRHVYFDHEKATNEREKFDLRLKQCYDELESGKIDKANQSFYDKFFIVKETPKRGRKVLYNEDAIQDAYNNNIGWFVLISNYIKDAEEALLLYRLKDAVEKAFDDLKNSLDADRLRIHSDKALHGRIFIQFIALIIMSQLRVIMKQHSEFSNYNVHELVGAMKTLKLVSIDGIKKKYTTEFSPMQKTIVDIFDLDV